MMFKQVGRFLCYVRQYIVYNKGTDIELVYIYIMESKLSCSILYSIAVFNIQIFKYKIIAYYLKPLQYFIEHKQ